MLSDQPQHFAVGPFTKDTFDKKRWEQTKLNISLSLTNENQKDAISEWKQALQLLFELNDCAEYNQYLEDDIIKNFFFRDFFGSITKDVILSQLPRKAKEFQDILNTYIQQIIVLLIRLLPENLFDLTETLKDILNPNSKYYLTFSDSNTSSEHQLKKVYALEKIHRCSNKFFTKLVNVFGEAGGFDKIYERVIDKTNWIPPDILTGLCSIIRNLSPFLCQDLAQEFLPKFKGAVCNNLLENPETTNVELTKQKFSEIRKSLDIALGAVNSYSKRKEDLEAFSLEICHTCLNSLKTESRIQGLYILFEITKGIKDNNLIRDFLEKNEILNKVYTAKPKVEVIKRSGYLLRYYLRHQIICKSDFEKLWTIATQGRMSLKLAIYRVLSYSATDLQREYLDDLIKKLIEIPARELTEEDINLIFDLFGSPFKSTWFFKKFFDFCWKIITTNAALYVSKIVEMTRNKFWAKLKHKDFKDPNMSILNSCLTNINHNISVLYSIKVIKILIKKYPKERMNGYKYTRKTLIDFLCEGKDLPTLLTRSLSKTKIYSQRNIPEKNWDAYRTEISKRVHFLMCLVTEGTPERKTITFQHLYDLWDSLIKNAILKPFEQELAFIFINKILKCQAITYEDQRKFFVEKMKPGGFCNLGIEAFECFTNIFFTINFHLPKECHEKAGAISENKIANTECIQNFMWNAEDDSLAERPFDILDEVCAYLNKDLRTIKTREYLDKYMENLKEALRNQRDLPDTIFVRQCLRSLKLINILIDESEKSGIGDLPIHTGTKNGELILLLLLDNIVGYGGHDKPKESKITISSDLTLYDLRVRIAEMCKIPWDQIALVRYYGPKEIRHNQNGKTLDEIGLKEKEVLIVKENNILRKNLLLEDDKFHPRVENILLDCFKEFSDFGLMSPEQLALFLSDMNYRYDPVKSAFNQYDDNRDSYLTEENFLKYHVDMYKSCPNVVWAILYKLGYRNDLKRPVEVKPEKANITSLLRYSLGNNQEYFDVLFSLLDLDNKDIVNEAWGILSRMATNPKILSDVVMMKGVREAKDKNKVDWNFIFELNSGYKLLYSLYIADTLLNETKSQKYEDYIEQSLLSQDTMLISYKGAWKSDFMVYRGLEHFFKIFETYLQKASVELTNCYKEILLVIIKILKREFPNMLNISSKNREMLIMAFEIIENHIKDELMEILGFDCDIIIEGDDQKKDLFEKIKSEVDKDNCTQKLGDLILAFGYKILFNK